MWNINTNSQIKFKTTITKSNLCDYSDAYVLLKGTITITGAGEDEAVWNADKRNKQVTFKNCAHIYVVMPMYNLIEHSNNYTKKHHELYGSATKI